MDNNKEFFDLPKQYFLLKIKKIKIYFIKLVLLFDIVMDNKQNNQQDKYPMNFVH